MRRRSLNPQQVTDFRDALSALVPAKHRPRVAALARVVAATLDSTAAAAAATEPASTPTDSSSAASAGATASSNSAEPAGDPAAAAAAAAPPPPPPPPPAFERMIGALRAELDREGVELSERRRVPYVPVVGFGRRGG